MAKTRLDKDQIAPKDLFENLIKGAQDAEEKIVSLTEIMKILQKMAKDLKSNIFKSDPKDVKSIEDLNIAAAKANQLAANKLAVGKELQKQKLKLQDQRKETNKLLREEIALENKQLGTLDKLKVRNAQLRRERDKLNLSTREGRSMLRTINAEIDRNNKIIEKNSDALKKQKIGIGRYEKALGGLRNTLGKLGIAFGGFALARNAINVTKDFETAIADLSAITGAEGKDLDFLKDKALEFSTQFGQSASEITEAFKLAGSARPELLQNGEALAALTEKAIILSKASGDDVPTSINNLAGTLNAFNKPAEDASSVMDILANAAQKGAKEIPFLTEAFTKFGGIAAAQGVSVSESAAAIEFLGKKIPDAATAGVSLRNVLLKLSAPDTLPKRALDKLKGLGIDLDKISDKTKPFNERLKELKPLLSDNAALTLTFGSQNVLAAQTLIEGSEALGSFNDQLSESGTAQAQMETKSKTLSEAIAKLRAGWERFLIKLTEGTGAGNALGGVVDKLTKAIKWLGDNVETVIKGVKILVEAFVAFKVAMKGLQLAENIKNLKKLSSGVSDLGKGLDGAKASAKAFGSALKGIGLSIAITAVIEFAKAFWDVASGAQRARFEVQMFNEATAQGAEKANAILEKNRGLLQDEINAIRQLRADKQISAEEEAKMIAEATAKRQKAIQRTIDNVEQSKKALQAEINTRREGVKVLEATIGGLQKLGLSNKQLDIDLGTQQNLLAKAEAKFKGLTVAQEELSKGAASLAQDIVEQTIAIKTNTNASAEETKETKEKTKAYKMLKEARLEEAEAGDNGAQKIADRLKKLNDLEDQRILNIADLEVLQAELDGDEETLLEAKIQRIEKERDVRTAMLAEGTVDRLKIEKEAALQIKALQDEADAKIAEAQAEREKQRLEMFKQSVETMSDLWTKAIDENIKKLKEQAAESQKLADQFKEQAKDGTITAKESLAEQNKLTAEANAEAARQEKRKQQILAASAFLESYISNLEAGDDTGTALAKAFSSKEVLGQVLAGLPAFYEGTEDTGVKGRGIDGKGGFLSVLHPNERVMTKDQNNRIGNISNEDLATIAERYRLGDLADGSQINVGWDNHILVERLMSVEDKLDQVNSTIANKPTHKTEAGKIIGGAMQILETTTKGNQVTTRKFRVKAKG